MTHRVNPDLEAWKLILPKEWRLRVIDEAHQEPQSGHLGHEKAYPRVALQYYRFGMFRDIVDYVKSCDTCQKCKVEQTCPAGMMG